MLVVQPRHQLFKGRSGRNTQRDPGVDLACGWHGVGHFRHEEAARQGDEAVTPSGRKLHQRRPECQQTQCNSGSGDIRPQASLPYPDRRRVVVPAVLEVQKIAAAA